MKPLKRYPETKQTISVALTERVPRVLRKAIIWKAAPVLALLLTPAILLRAEGQAGAAFTLSAEKTAVFDFVEVSAKVNNPDGRNPFTDAVLTGDFESAGAAEKVDVEGFCDSTNGGIYRIRFMPSKAGSYTFHVTLKSGRATQTYAGEFTATDEHRRGPLRIDLAYPWHFIWEGTGEHYFFAGTTAYWLMGWRDEATIQYSIDRLARLKVNRMRVSVSGRTSSGYGGR